ncbi:TPA: Ig-like domain repeat protein, partial [Klebsiella aerogenes]|nr:Ig-like domain repeat protein [Klebsiella aerogenes]
LQVTDDVGGEQGGVSNGGITDDTTPTLSGTAEPGSTVTIFDKGIQIGTALVAEDGSWSFTTSALPKGEHSFTTVVTDEAGNTSDSSPPFVITIELIDDSDADADSD